jgi:hypothetical protein
MNSMIATMVSLAAVMPVAILPLVLAQISYAQTEVYICPLKLHLDDLNYTRWCHGFAEDFNEGLN